MSHVWLKTFFVITSIALYGAASSGLTWFGTYSLEMTLDSNRLTNSHTRDVLLFSLSPLAPFFLWYGWFSLSTNKYRMPEGTLGYLFLAMVHLATIYLIVLLNKFTFDVVLALTLVSTILAVSLAVLGPPYSQIRSLKSVSKELERAVAKMRIDGIRVGPSVQFSHERLITSSYIQWAFGEPFSTDENSMKILNVMIEDYNFQLSNFYGCNENLAHYIINSAHNEAWKRFRDGPKEKRDLQVKATLDFLTIDIFRKDFTKGIYAEYARMDRSEITQPIEELIDENAKLSPTVMDDGGGETFSYMVL